METTKQALTPSDPKEAPYNTLHKNEATSAHTITVDTTLKGKTQTPKSNGDDIQMDNSLTGMIVDTEGPQDTQAEIMGNSKTAEANAPPPTEPTRYRHTRQSWASRTRYEQETTRNKYGKRNL